MELILYDMKNIRYILTGVLAAMAALLSVASCSKEEWPDGADLNSLRVALSPNPGTIPAAGKTFEAVVTVARGTDTSVSWDAEVDFAPDWISISEITIDKDFTGTFDGDDTTVSQKGLKVIVNANGTGKKRTASIRFTVKDGSSVSYTLTQAK